MMDKKFTILPRPYEIKREKGDFLLSGDTVIRIGSISEETDNSARYLKERIEEAAGFCLDIRPLCQKEEGGIELKKDERLSYPESYRLTVTESCIRITGADEAGLFYGVVTLSLIMEQNGAAIPCCSIEDGPRFAVRGIYIDAARGQVMKIESLKKMADFCARYKINQIQIYIQNTYAFEEMEEAYLLTTPYTPEEIREFVLYCRRLHIECVPSLALLGHMYEILNTYAFRKFCTLDADPAEPFTWMRRQIHHTLDLSNTDSFALIQSMIDQYLPLFDCHVCNITCDEPNDFGIGKSREYVEKRGGKSRAYAEYCSRLAAYIREQYHMESQFWSDFILREPECLNRFDSRMICLHWDYSADPQETDAKKMSETGMRWIACPGVAGWNTFLPFRDTAEKNIRKMAVFALKYGAEGVITTEWGDFGHINLLELEKPAMIESASLSWNPLDTPEEDEMSRIISFLEYGDQSGASDRILRESSRLCRFDEHQPWRTIVMFMDLLDGSRDVNMADLDYLAKIPAKMFHERCAGLQNLYEEWLRHSSYIDLPKQRTGIPCVAVGIEGAWICMALLAFIAEFRYGTENAMPVKKAYLIRKIEKWLQKYDGIWRSAAKESELWRINFFIKRVIGILYSL